MITKETKKRKLKSGRKVSQFNREIDITISSMRPDKWLFVDMETGDIWHRREDALNQKYSYPFWRAANKKELKELKELINKRIDKPFTF